MSSGKAPPDSGSDVAADVFRLPHFFAFWTSETVSVFGTYITTLAIQTAIVLLLGGTATDVGLVTMAALLPNLLFGPFAGAVIDRFRRLRMLIATDVCNGAVLGLLPLLWITGGLSTPVLMAIMFTSSTLTILNRAASQSALPRLVAKRHLLAANARIDQGASLAQTVGNFIAGGLIAVFGAPMAILANMATYFASAAAIATIRLDEPPQKPGAALGSIHREVGEGIAWLYRHDVVGPLALSTHVWFFANGVVGTALVAYTLQAAELGPFWLGFIYAIAGVAGLVGSFFAVGAGRWLGEGSTVIACRALACLAWIPAALMPDQAPVWLSVTLLTLCQALFGLSIGVENASESSIWQSAVPDALQARVVATRRSLNRAMIVVGAPIGGILSDAMGFGVAFWLGVACFGAAAGALMLAGFRNLPQT